MNKQTIAKMFKNVSIWKRGDERAPNKPLLILLALGKCYRDEERLILYDEIDAKLKTLLIEFGPSRKSIHTEYPFWRLQNDKIWEVISDTDNLQRRIQTSDSYHEDIPKSELKKHCARGGFTKDIFDALSKDKSLILNLAKYYLDGEFPETLHDDILSAVGLEINSDNIKRKRSPEFRERILRAYEYSCVVCGLNIRYYNNSCLCVEAAHIKWHQAGGPDEEKNGLALCVLHHKLFDRGAFTIADNNSILVSQHIHGDAGFKEWLLRYHRQPLRMPVSDRYMPDPSYSSWHQKEVFKFPSRD